MFTDFQFVKLKRRDNFINLDIKEKIHIKLDIKEPSYESSDWNCLVQNMIQCLGLVNTAMDHLVSYKAVNPYNSSVNINLSRTRFLCVKR
jgi:hypothetical protein